MFSDTIVVDTNYIFPSSIQIFANNNQIPDSLWTFDANSSTLFFKTDTLNDFIIKYRTLPYSFKSQSFMDTSLIVPKMKNFNPDMKNNFVPISNSLNSNNLTTSGYLKRGVGVGNNQDAVVTSKMNLHITGKLSDDLNIEAEAFDEQMPIQPDGNSANIQQLNNIFIKVYNDDFQLAAGDFTVQKPHSYFLNYNKQVKGIRLFKQNANSDFNVGFAVAKGKYKRQQFQGIEANQGPYRLTGSAGETYIVVLAGSEKVYLDGKLLKRGDNQDYTINYNTAELVFTAKNPITKNSRIIVEFEYSERNYARFTSFANSEFAVKKSKFYFNVYSEADAKNQTIDRELTDTMKNIMFDVGDSINQAVLPTIDTVVFSENMILYRKIDTLIDDEVFTVYKYSTNPQFAVYQVNFAYVGAGNGDYVVSNQVVNGRIYKFIKPKNGKKQGDYQPYTKLVTPKKHQIFDFGGFVPISSSNSIDFDIAFSNFDENLFSPFDDKNNVGTALKLDFRHFFRGDDTSICKTYFFTNFEFASNTFKPVENYKSQEFNRDWNIDNAFLSDENLLEIGYFNVSEKGSIKTSVSSLYHSQEFFAVKPQIVASRVGERRNFAISADLLHSDNPLNVTNFARSNIDFSQKVSFFVAGVNYEQETNLWQPKSADSLLANSYMFHSFETYLQNADTARIQLKVAYKRRFDFLPNYSSLEQVSYSDNFNILTNFKRQFYDVNFVINYRKLFVQDTALLKISPENSLNSQMMFNFHLFDDAFVSSSQIVFNSGLEQKLQFIFIKVEPTKGVYTWIDYNKDGIKQIDEFEVAQFSDQADFVKVPMQSTEYEKVFVKNFSQSFSFYPAKLFSDTSNAYKIASKFNDNFSVLLNQKSYQFDIADFSADSSINYSFFLNNVFSLLIVSNIQLSLISQKSNKKVVLISGIDDISTLNQTLKVDFHLIKNFSFIDEVSAISSNVSSDYSIQKNYNILSKKNNFQIRFYKDKFDFSSSYLYADKRNRLGNEVLFMNNLSTMLNYSMSVKNSVSINVSYIYNRFAGDASTSVAYFMMQGLKPDENYTWQFSFNRKLGKIMQLSVLYSGRYSTGNKIIHNGTVSLMAYL